MDRIDIAQVSIILLFLFQFDNRTARSTKIKLLEVRKSNFWSSLFKLLHRENPVGDGVFHKVSFNTFSPQYGGYGCGKGIILLTYFKHRTGQENHKIYRADVAEVKKILHDIWLSERQLLLKIRF